MIDGFAIGHHTADGDGWLTGTTVVLAPTGAVGGVDVRGGGPGTRETDLLDPRAMVERVHAVVLTGGSAYGLAAADGVMAGLEAAGIGLPGRSRAQPGGAHRARGGDLRSWPGRAVRPPARPRSSAPERSPRPAPTSRRPGASAPAPERSAAGSRAGSGTPSTGSTRRVAVGAAVVVNATGSPVEPVTGRLRADREHRLPAPTAAERDALAAAYATAVRPWPPPSGCC